ncbi:MAG: tRNA pseudouridine(38-40) synthase TruA [Thermoanaerobaculia bacterium]
MVYRLTLSYHGAAYAGWQRQKNAASVQQTVEEALVDLLGRPQRIFAAGRTDAGVHARGQVAHLELTRPFALKGLVHGTNHRLPSDIRVLAAHRMAAGFDARKHALGKEYLYRVYRGRVVPPIDDPLVLRVESPLDVAAMRRAAIHLPGVHDFTAFALQGGSHGQPFRHLFAASIDEHGRELRLRFFGAGFLRGMVRTLVGTLLEIGRGRRPPENLRDLLARAADAEPPRAGPTARARGLCLQQVFYPPRWQPIEGYEA